MKVLLISHNPVCTYNAMGKTFVSLFSTFRREELCELYIYPSYPDLNMCSSFYRITDKEVVKNLLRFRSPGHEVSQENIHIGQQRFENKKDEGLYRNRKNKSPVRRLCRDLCWSLSRWYGKPLKEWMERERPTCIFVAPGAAKFIYTMALKLSTDYHLPLISYLCDEYYFVDPADTLLGKIQLRMLQKKIKALMTRSAGIVTISEELKEAYGSEFHVPAKVIMTGSSFKPETGRFVDKVPQSISYFGNIRSNRYLSLADVGRTLDTINRERGTAFQLKIYTAESDPEILEAFNEIQSVQLCGFLGGEDFQQTLQAADVLLHVEAFDKKSIDFVKHSISTKIADSLSCGVPLVAYGPACVSSVAYLVRHDCALTAISQEQLHQILCEAFFNAARREQCVFNALKTAGQYHSRETNSHQLHEWIALCSGDEN